MIEQEKEIESLKMRTEFTLFLAIIALVASAIHFFAGTWHADQTNQRLQRLEKIVGMDEIGRKN